PNRRVVFRGTRVAALPTQGCGPSALPLGYLGIHRFAVRVSAGPRGGRRVAAGRLVRGLGGGGARMDARTAWHAREPESACRIPGDARCGAPHPGVRTFGPAPGLPWDPPLRGSRFSGATRWPPLRGRPVGARVGGDRKSVV